MRRWGEEGSVVSHIHLLLPLLLLLLFQSVSSLHCRPHCWWSGNSQGLCIEMSLVEREHTVFQFVRLNAENLEISTAWPVAAGISANSLYN